MDGILREPRGFQWDKGNAGKNETKHGVTDREAEEIFFSRPLLIARSPKGPGEVRYAALGKTHGGRFLTVVFTVRSDRIRVISARPMSKKERETYEKEG